MSVRELRPELLEQCDILQAILAFNYWLTPKIKRDLDITRERIPVATAKGLRQIRDDLHENVKKFVKAFGCIQKPSVFAADFIADSKIPVGIPNISKAEIDRSFFTNFCNGHPKWQEFPPHLRLELNFNWVVPEEQFQFHYWLAEAVLYEDMALAFNHAFQTLSAIQKTDPSKGGGNVNAKEHYMYLRTALLSAYYFVEAFLNGIAFDYHYRNESSLSQSNKDLLMEWNSQANRQRFVSFENKIKEYPKIITGATPLTVTNCKELATLLGDAKSIRDSIVHQSPKAPDKIRWLQVWRLDNTQEVVDAAVGFVTKLNTALGPNGTDIAWLYQRDPTTGVFPPEAFN
jgi:hypothetical protein